jgi:hypothetical protein
MAQGPYPIQFSTLGKYIDHAVTSAHECKSEGQQLLCHTCLGNIHQYCEAQHFMQLLPSNTSLELGKYYIVRFLPVRISQITGGTVMLSCCYVSVLRLFLGFVLQEYRKSDLLVCFLYITTTQPQKRIQAILERSSFAMRVECI